MAPRTAAASRAVPGHDLLVMRRVAVWMFAVGSLTSLSGVWVTQQTAEGKVAQAVVTVCLALAAAVLVAVRRPRRWMLHGAVLSSIGLLGALMACSEPLGVGSFFYLWPVVFAAYFCHVRFVVLAYGWMTITLGVGLSLNDTHDQKLDTFVGTFSTVGLMAVLVASMTTREARLRRELAVAAETDPLTGVLNRRSFNPRLADLVERAAAEQRPLSVVMIDLDHFKRLNDQHGHSVGDRALQEVGAVLDATSRDGDLVARFGGEEFAIALPGADAAAAEAYTERVAAAIRSGTGVPGLLLSASAGICTLTAPGASAETLVQRADAALYAAKAAGRDRPAQWTDDGVEIGPPFGGRPSLAAPAAGA